MGQPKVSSFHVTTWVCTPGRRDRRCKGPVAFLYFSSRTFQNDKGHTNPRYRILPMELLQSRAERPDG